jgi:phenylacetate-CoA ligase
MKPTNDMTPKFPDAQDIATMQDELLRQAIAYVHAHSPYYREVFDSRGIDASSIRTVADLRKLPVTVKEDIQLRNDDFLCVPRQEIAEYTSTSGTLGSPVTIALTASDLQRLARNEYGSFTCADGSPEDVYQLMLTLDRQFMAGMAYYSGLRMLGAGIIRVGPGVPSLQWECIQRLRPTAIVAVPSFILKLIQYAEQHGIDIKRSSVRKAICIGENIRDTDLGPSELGKRILQSWPIKLYGTYASTEMQTAFTECSEGKGGHLQPDLLIVELLDDQGEPVADGQTGEVTVTTLGIEGMPLLRYRTGDLCRAYREPCACGRHSLRLSPVIGRKKQMIKFKGTTLFLPALAEILHSMEDVHDYVVEAFSNDIGTDEILLHLLPSNTMEETDRKIRAYLQAKLRVSPHIRFVEAAEMQQLQFPGPGRKPVRFIDRRS